MPVFCSAQVLSPRILLTAAHCLRPLPDMAVHYRDASGAAVIIPVDNAVAHPLYGPNAIQGPRVESIDLALIRTTRPLDPRFVAAAIAVGEPPAIGAAAIVSGYGAAREGDWSSGGTLRSVALAVREPPAIGAAAIVSGYGAAREGDWSSGGTLRSVALAVREPASKVLIWAADPAGREAGACNGAPAPRSGRRMDRPRLRSSPARRRCTAVAAAASPKDRCSRRSGAGLSRRSGGYRAQAEGQNRAQMAAVRAFRWGALVGRRGVQFMFIWPI